MTFERRRPRAGWGMLVAAVLVAAAPASAQRFDVPEGFVAAAEPDASSAGDWRGVLTVRPEDGPFARLSTVRLREVAGPVEDAGAWLKRRITLDVAGEDRVAKLLDSPDSPFGDPMFDALREAIPRLFSGFRELSALPLDACEGPATAYNAAGELHELYCAFQVGPLRQYLVLRLQNAGDRWYYTEIRAMNERRLRHLIAIANSFRLD
ncbi:MAG: hypothetical protein ACFCUO_11900 [Rhodospirillales bacterium]